MKPEEFEEFIRRNPDEARRLISKAFVPRELLKVGNRSYVNAYKYPESRFDPKDLCSDGHNCPNPDMLQPLSDPGKLFTDKYVVPPSSLIFQWANRIYDKKWWGEVAGGITDAATVINAANDALPDGIGGSILIKVGAYDIKSTIKIYRYTWLIGESIEGTYLNHSFNGDLIQLVKRPGTTESIGFVRISNFYIWGNKNTYPTGNCINCVDFSDCIIDHNFINAFGEASIKLSAGYYHHVHNNWVESNGYGLYTMNAVGDNFISDNTLSKSSEDNIYDDGTINKYIGNTIKEAQKNGYNSRAGAPWCKFIGNNFSNNGKLAANTYYHLDINGIANIMVGNHFFINANLKHVIRLWDGSKSIIQSNYFENSGATGYIDPVASTGLRICNNTGYVTENRVSATIAAAATSIVFAHGCSYTPAAGDIHPTLTNLPTTPIGDIYVDTIGAANATLHCTTPPGVATAIFNISIQRTP